MQYYATSESVVAIRGVDETTWEREDTMRVLRPNNIYKFMTL